MKTAEEIKREIKKRINEYEHYLNDNGAFPVSWENYYYAKKELINFLKWIESKNNDK